MMTTIARSLEKHNPAINTILVLALAALLVMAPAEATLGNVVKVVFAHGAAERISSYAYLLAGGLGLVQLALNRSSLARWTRAALETAIVFWLAQFLISIPAQILAWGGLTWNEPRVAGATWILLLTSLGYVVARWIGDQSWMALAGTADAAIVIVILQGSINVLHPLSPIIGSDSLAIKFFYAAIVILTGVIAVQFARARAATS